MPKKILLADDSITIQKVVELTFSDGDYEVTAVNNGAKAVQKLAEMRPDIILSDIIMPEKNGYEVCEYVKSHPEYRHLPVILLTGTFEPFDPDRAEKAGCDAVVTKPFESQSLIQKVEELITQAESESRAAAPAPEPEPQPAPSPWAEEDAPQTAAADLPAAGEPFTHDADVFSAAPAEQEAAEMPFETPSDSPFGEPPPAEDFSGETRAFQKMSFDDLQQMGAQPAASQEPERQPEARRDAEPAPWEAQPEEYSGETRAFTKMSFDDFAPQQPAPESRTEAEPEQRETESPLGAAPRADDAAPEQPAFGGDIGRVPDFSLQPQDAQPQPEPDSPWAEQSEAPAYGGETRAFEKMSVDDFQQTPQSEPEIRVTPEPPPWDQPEEPAYSGETRAFPKMSFEDLQRTGSEQPQPETATPEPEPQPAPAPWDEQPQAASAATPRDEQPAPPAWSPPAEPEPEQPAAESFSSPFGEPMPEETPFTHEQPAEAEPAQPQETAAAAADAAQAEAEPEEPAVPSTVIASDAAAIPIAARGELTDEQVDRIARRVVELMSEQVIRNIAWEVIPDLAEMVVKERIRQLESEA